MEGIYIGCIVNNKEGFSLKQPKLYLIQILLYIYIIHRYLLMKNSY